ncbi:MAG: carbohydrate binding family 9 domain-containing protein [Acidobacteria bacterium]|nr:carbohydrate binding family 9 domain-containing protein [Acidobacteriota bacterium]
MSVNVFSGTKLILYSLALVYFLTFSASAQDGSHAGAGTHGRKSIRAFRSESPVTVDGNMDEPAWREAPVSLGFIQKDPHEGQPSSERTEFRVLYTVSTLYIGVICYDSDPTGILATDRRRDSRLDNDDTITLVMDTFHDHRNAFMFRTNPLGTQYDALITDEGNTLNENWDEKWEVAVQVSPAGWTAEFAIPFKSLRVNQDDGSVWGLDLQRVIRRKNEQAYWNNYRRGFKLESLSQAGHLQGIENIETGMRFRVKPYLLAGGMQEVRRQSPLLPGADPFRTVTKNSSDVGMEVMKYRITPSLTADFTWNTDFAQTEVDDQQVNLDRFPVFFPEKREFFLEGAGIYEFGLVRAEATTDMKVFHTRRIGLAEGRIRAGSSEQRVTLPVPITAGARLTGNLQGFTLGLMNVQTEPLESLNITENNYSVLRMKRNVFSRSFIGGFLLNREIGGSADFNRVYGLDANFTFYRYLTLGALWAKSSERNDTEQDWVSTGTAKWEDDFWVFGADYVFIEPNFRDDLGFVGRKNMRRVTPQLGIKPRPRSGPIRQIRLVPRFDYITDRDWTLQSRTNHYTVRFELQDGGSIAIQPHSIFERLARPFEVRRIDDPQKPVLLVVPPGDYNWWYYGFLYNSNPARRLSGSVRIQPEPGYYGGDLMRWNLTPRYRVTQNLAAELSYQINQFTFKESEFTDHVINFSLYYNLNNQWLTTTTIQYNNVDTFAGLNFRLNYIFRPGDDFFLVYNEGRRIGGPFDGQKDRSLQAKLTYSFDF